MLVSEKENLTPPQLARRWGVNTAKIYALIQSGQLEAVNLAVNPKGIPRLRIKLAEIERFEQSRSTKPAEKTPRRRRATATAGKEYV